MIPAGPGAGPTLGVVRRRVVVHGLVHGVGFRASCARRAVSAGVAGSVRNCADGTVEAVFEGDPAVVDSLVAWCHYGPALAQVTAVDVGEERPVGARTFVVR